MLWTCRFWMKLVLHINLAAESGVVMKKIIGSHLLGIGDSVCLTGGGGEGGEGVVAYKITHKRPKNWLKCYLNYLGYKYMPTHHNVIMVSKMSCCFV